MTGSTHGSVGLALGIALGIAAHDKPLGVLVLAVVVGVSALLPDVDHPQSTLGRRVVVGALIFHHRGFTHSLVALVLVGLAAWRWLPFPIAVGVAAGYGSHLLLDALNPQGVPLLWPLRGRVSVLHAATGGLLDQLLRVAALLAVFVLFTWMSTGKGF